VRWGRKATGLEKKTAGLPKDKYSGCAAFCIKRLINRYTTEAQRRREKRFCRLKGYELLKEVYQGKKFADGVVVPLPSVITVDREAA
jgi:hypothetical protein